MLALALRLRAETADWLTAGEVGHLFASILVSQLLRLSLRYHLPHFSSSQGILPIEAIGRHFTELFSHPGLHPLSRGDSCG